MTTRSMFYATVTIGRERILLLIGRFVKISSCPGYITARSHSHMVLKSENVIRATDIKRLEMLKVIWLLCFVFESEGGENTILCTLMG